MKMWQPNKFIFLSYWVSHQIFKVDPNAVSVTEICLSHISLHLIDFSYLSNFNHLIVI